MVDNIGLKIEDDGGRMEDKKEMSYRDLRVYQSAFQLQQDIFVKTKDFPIEERYSLTDQLRRSSRSIGANLAEAWKKRRCEAHFVSKLTDSEAEMAETQHWLLTACKCDYIDIKSYNELIRRCNDIKSILVKMMREARMWTASRKEDGK